MNWAEEAERASRRRAAADAYVRGVLARRLFSEPPVAELSHAALAVAGLAVFCRTVPAAGLAAWMGAVAATSVIRLVLRVGARRHDASNGISTTLRIAIVAVAAAWGAGAFFFAPG